MAILLIPAEKRGRDDRTRLMVPFENPPFYNSPSPYPSPLGDCVVMADRGQRASFGSFRIAVIRRLWATVLMVENDVCMVNNHMILFAKRFRSKAPSAASLFPIQLVDRRRVGFDFLPIPYCDIA